MQGESAVLLPWTDSPLFPLGKSPPAEHSAAAFLRAWGVAVSFSNSSQRASLAATRAARVPIEIQLDGFVGFSIATTMERIAMKKLARPAVISATSDESAIEWARRRLLELCGPRGWHDTHESMFARAGKLVAINPRRVRAIVQRERHTKVSGDEMLAIQRAVDALGTLSALARAADARANSEAGDQGIGSVREGSSASWATTRAAARSDRT